MFLDRQVELDSEVTADPQDPLVLLDLWDQQEEPESLDDRVQQEVLDLQVLVAQLGLLDHRAGLEPVDPLEEWGLMDRLVLLANLYDILIRLHLTCLIQN